MDKNAFSRKQTREKKKKNRQLLLKYRLKIGASRSRTIRSAKNEERLDQRCKLRTSNNRLGEPIKRSQFSMFLPDTGVLLITKAQTRGNEKLLRRKQLYTSGSTIRQGKFGAAFDEFPLKLFISKFAEWRNNKQP